MQSEPASTGLGFLAPSGRLDAAAAPHLQDEFTAQFDQGNRYLIVNLAGVPYVSSSTLRVLLVARKRAIRAGGDLILCCLLPHVSRVISMIGFDQIFTICASEDEARQQASSMQATARLSEEQP